MSGFNGRILVFSTLIVSFLMLMSHRATADQPPQEWSTVEVPVYVLIDAQGKAELVTALWGPARGAPDAVLAKVLPESIPVFTDVDEGDLIRGVVCYSSGASGGENFAVEVPKVVKMSPNESPRLEFSTQPLSLTRTNQRSEPAAYMAFANSIHSVPVSESEGRNGNHTAAVLPRRSLSWDDNLLSQSASMHRVPAWVELDEFYNDMIVFCFLHEQIMLEDDLTTATIMTRHEDETLRLGIQQINDPNNPIITDVLQSSAVPLIISIGHSTKSGYILTHGSLLRSFESLKISHRIGTPEKTSVSDSHRVRILQDGQFMPQSNARDHDSRPNTIVARGGMTFQFPAFVGTPPQNPSTNQAFTDNEMRSAMFTASNFFICMFNSANVKVEVEFSDRGAAAPAMETSTVSLGADYDYILDKMELFAGNNSEAADEAIYSAFPENILPIHYDAPVITQVNQVFLSRSLKQLLLFSNDGTKDATIIVNTNMNIKWDLNPKDGLAQSHLDFRGVFAHEILHVLGFNSILPFATSHPMPATTVPTILDCFRFEPQSIGQNINSFELMTVPRRVERGVDSVTVTLKDQPDGLYDMATGKQLNGMPPGDDDQASHWKKSADRNNLIGIMDPSIFPGEIAHPVLSDFRALDIIGWDLVPGFCEIVSRAVILNNPVNIGQDISIEPILFLDY